MKASSSLVDMGMKYKDMYGSPAEPASEKDMENKMCYPSLDLRDKQAEMMGAADLKVGEYLQQTVVWKVKRREETDVNGKKSYRLELELVKGSDMEATDEEGDETAGESDGDDEAPSPGLAYLMGNATD